MKASLHIDLVPASELHLVPPPPTKISACYDGPNEFLPLTICGLTIQGDWSSGGRAGCPVTERLAVQIPVRRVLGQDTGPTLNGADVRGRWWSEGPPGSDWLPGFRQCGYTCSFPPPV